MPRLLLLTQYFPPEMGAPQARLSELGERLTDLGWEVEVLTALPNYPTGQVFEGYPRRRPLVETIGRLRTVRVPLLPAKTGFAKRLACYLSFAASAAWYGPGRCQRPDLLLVESPPLFLGWGARALAWRLRCPWMLNVSDLWPASAIHMGVVQPGLATRLAEGLERSLYRRARGVTGQSEEILAAVREKAPETPTAVITNGVDPSRFGPHRATPEDRELIRGAVEDGGDGDRVDGDGGDGGPVFLYAGLLGLAQGLPELVERVAQLPPEVPGRLVLVGDGPVREQLERRLAERPTDRVRLVPAQPRERIPALLAAADVALVSLGLTLPGAVPSKIYEAMAASLPILILAGGEAARRVEVTLEDTDPDTPDDAPAGIAVPPGDFDGLEAAWRRLAADPELRRRLGENGRRAAETTYHRGRIAERFDAFLRSLLAASGSPDARP